MHRRKHIPIAILVALGVVLSLLISLIWSASQIPTPPAPEVAIATYAPPPREPGPASRSYVRPVPNLEKVVKKIPQTKPMPKAKATPTSTPKPEPTKTQAAPPPVKQTPTTANETLACIRHHESRGNYGVVSEVRAGVTYQGAYQLSSRYTAVWATRYGHAEWANKPAHTWPASVQDDVALKLGRQSNPDWRMWSDFTSYHCPGFVT